MDLNPHLALMCKLLMLCTNLVDSTVVISFIRYMDNPLALGCVPLFPISIDYSHATFAEIFIDNQSQHSIRECWVVGLFVNFHTSSWRSRPLLRLSGHAQKYHDCSLCHASHFDLHLALLIVKKQFTFLHCKNSSFSLETYWIFCFWFWCPSSLAYLSITLAISDSADEALPEHKNKVLHGYSSEI